MNGIDHLIGVHHSIGLSDESIKALHSIGLIYLDHIIKQCNDHYPIWKEAKDIDLDEP